MRRPAPQRSGWRLAAATVVSICLVLVVAHAVTARVDRERLRALRAEHHSIESELQQVKAIAEHPQPVVVLENDDTRMTVDVADHRAAGDQPLQPVVY